MKLKPRKRIDPVRMPRPDGKPIAACCAFCSAKIARATKVAGTSSAPSGSCSCGVVFVDDSTGKLGGEAIVEGLSLLADGNLQRAMTLREGTDYDCKVLAYREISHEIFPAADPNRVGVGRIFYFRRAPRESGAV